MMPPMIWVRDLEGADYARFLVLEDQPGAPVYFGGLAREIPPSQQIHGIYGPHMWIPLVAMFGIIGNLANVKEANGPRYQLHGADTRKPPVMLTPDMSGAVLAEALGCAASKVIDHYGLTVRLVFREVQHSGSS